MTFMAECFWPGVTVQKVADAGDRLRHASRAIAPGDGLARYLGSILVPSDEIALCLFEAASIDVAAEVNRRAGLRPSGFSKSCAWTRSSRVATTSQHPRQRRLDEPSP